MKSYGRGKGVVWLGLILMPLISLIANGCGTTEPVGGGSPLFTILIENQTDQVLTIYTVYGEDYEIGSVEPGGQIRIKNLSMNMGWYPIKAANAERETVFLETYTFMPDDKYHLQKIEERLYKAVIPPLED